MMENKDIVNNLLNKTDSNVGKAMNLVQDIVEKNRTLDEIGVSRFFKKLDEEIALCDEGDSLIVNSRVFDWKELDKPEVLDELIILALKSMSTEKSKNKLKAILQEE